MVAPVIWAFGFANLPLLQFGIAAASLPILIHLLNRRKYREMRWAAMRFLVAALQKNQRRVKIEQWLLLAARTLVILLAVSAMAKPFLESLGAVVLPGQRTHRVIVLDGSMSMAFVAGDQSRFDQAKALAGQLVRDARRGDVLSVVLMGEPPRVVVGDASPSANGSEVIKEIDALHRPDGATDLVASFEAVDRVLGVSPIPRKEVIFITDLQVASWRGRGGANTEPLKRAVAKLDARQVVSVVIDLGKEGNENRAIVDFRLDAPLVTVGGPAPKVLATVRNFSTKPAYDVRARLSIDGQVGPDQSVPEIGAGLDRTFAFLPGFTTPGDHLVEVRIDDDALPTDNKRALVVPVRDALNVLLVDGSPKPEAFKGETDYLKQALSPDEKSADPNMANLGGPVAATIRTEVVLEAQLSARDLSSFDAVVLCNVAEFGAAEVTALDAFLKQGGGVVIFGGDGVDAASYNRVLYRDGEGILPAAIGETIGDSTAKQGGFEFDAKDFKHPIVALFQGAAANVLAGLTGAKTWQYQKLKLPSGGLSQAKVALSFNSGDPAIVEVPRFRGRVIQVATSADVGWTTWPLHQSYPPIMEQIVLEAAAGRLSERNVRVGQPIDRALPASAGGADVEVVRPDEARVATKLQPSGDVSLFHFEDTDLAGLYRAKFAAPVGTESLFAANVDPIESDPAKLDRAGLFDAVPGWKPTYLTNWKDLSQSATSVGRRGELHRPLLYGLLGMLLVESMMAWWFGNHRR